MPPVYPAHRPDPLSSVKYELSLPPLLQMGKPRHRDPSACPRPSCGEWQGLVGLQLILEAEPVTSSVQYCVSRFCQFCPGLCPHRRLFYCSHSPCVCEFALCFCCLPALSETLHFCSYCNRCVTTAVMCLECLPRLPFTP